MVGMDVVDGVGDGLDAKERRWRSGIDGDQMGSL